MARILYVINDFKYGGAQAGLRTMATLGLFDNHDLRVLGIARGDEAGLTDITAAGHSVEWSYEGHHPTSSAVARFGLQLELQIRGFRPHIVIASLPQANLAARLVTNFRREVTFISFEHNSRLSTLSLESAFRLTSSAVDWVFADSSATATHAMRRLYSRRPPGFSVVPLVAFSAPPLHPRSLSGSSVRLVAVGRQTFAKNHSALICALRIIRQRGVDASLAICGEGPMQVENERLAADMGVRSWVNFEGHVADWPRRPYDMFVLASRYEGLCISALEAMHAGIPVVGPVVGGMSDYASAETMVEAASNRPEDLADAVLYALSAPTSVLDRARRARTLVQERYSADAVASSYDRLSTLLSTLPTANRRRRHPFSASPHGD